MGAGHIQLSRKLRPHTVTPGGRGRSCPDTRAGGPEPLCQDLRTEVAITVTACSTA